MIPYVEIKLQKRINKSYNWVAKRLYADTFEVDNILAPTKYNLNVGYVVVGNGNKAVYHVTTL